MIKSEANNKYIVTTNHRLCEMQRMCCVSLYCVKTDGFPADKVAGKPCKNLMSDFRCAIHSQLAQTSKLHLQDYL